MTFSDFLQLTYPYLSNGQKDHKYVRDILTQIMADPFTENEKKLHRAGYYYPTENLNDDTLSRIYSGKRELSKKAASSILSHLDKQKFTNYVYSMTPESVVELGKHLIKNGIIMTNEEEIAETCTELLTSLLLNTAQKKRQSNDAKKEYEDIDAKPSKPPSNENLFSLFNAAILQYQINDFIEQIDPTTSMNFSWVDENCEEFLAYVRQSCSLHLGRGTTTSPPEVLQLIHDFTNCLDEYTQYLALNMRPAYVERNPEYAVPLFRDENPEWARNFNTTVQGHRHRLCKIYHELSLMHLSPGNPNG